MTWCPCPRSQCEVFIFLFSNVILSHVGQRRRDGLICLLGSPDMWPYTRSSGDRRWWCVATDRVAHLDTAIFTVNPSFLKQVLVCMIQVREIGCVMANGPRALICYWDHLKIFFAEITQGPSGMSIGTIWMDQKRFQGPPARGFWFI